jgi:hypothetical protein
VVSFDFVEGRGYTHAGRHRAVLDDGRSVFVKSAVDELSAGWLRLEHVVYANVDGPFLPRFHAYDEEDGLPLLVLEDLSDAYWPPPWRDRDVAAVRESLDALAVTDAPRGLTPIHVWKEDWLSRWRSVEQDPEPFLSTGVGSRAWLDANLRALEAAAARAPLEDGSSLIHLDVRSDNLALTERGALLVDWNWASSGNPLVDLVAWAPSFCIETGTQPEDLVDAEGAGECAALISGVWMSVAGLPPPPTGTQRLRDAQLAQLRICLPWACRVLGIPEPG